MTLPRFKQEWLARNKRRLEEETRHDIDVATPILAQAKVKRPKDVVKDTSCPHTYKTYNVDTGMWKCMDPKCRRTAKKL